MLGGQAGGTLGREGGINWAKFEGTGAVSSCLLTPTSRLAKGRCTICGSVAAYACLGGRNASMNQLQTLKFSGHTEQGKGSGVSPTVGGEGEQESPPSTLISSFQEW